GLAIPQTGYLLDGSYLRLKNLTIGYSLPQRLLDRLHVNRLRVYVSGENLTEWSEVKDYFDPESITDNIDKLDPSRETAAGWGYGDPSPTRLCLGRELQF